MIEINLLPKELQKKRFSFQLDKTILTVLGGCVAVLALLAVYSYVYQARQCAGLQHKLQEAKAESARYATEIVKIDEIEKKKEQVLARMASIELLDRNREYWVALMEDISSRVPEYVWLSSVKQAPAIMPPATPPSATAPTGTMPEPAVAALSSIEGYSFSLNGLATFLIRLKKSDMFDKVELASAKLQELDKNNAYSFRLTCNLVPSVVRKVQTDVQTAQVPDEQENEF